MDRNAINELYAAKRDDGRWGIANDYTGRSQYIGNAFETEAAAIEAANKLNHQSKEEDA